MPFRAAKCLQA